MNKERLSQISQMAIIVAVFLAITGIFQFRVFFPKNESIQNKRFDLPLSRGAVMIDESVFKNAVNQSEWAEYHRGLLSNEGEMHAKEGSEERFLRIVNRNGLIQSIDSLYPNTFTWKPDENCLVMPTKDKHIMVPTWVLYEFRQYLPYDN